jgi:hypothetical protein
MTEVLNGYKFYLPFFSSSVLEVAFLIILRIKFSSFDEE